MLAQFSRGNDCPHIPSPISHPSPLHPIPYFNLLSNLISEEWCIQLSAWRTTYTNLLYEPVELFRHQCTGTQRSNEADPHHKGLSPVVLGINCLNSYQTKSGSCWLNATQTLTTGPSYSLGRYKSSPKYLRSP